MSYMKKRAYKTRIDALLALYSCRRSGRVRNNYSRHERRIYEHNGKFYLTSMAKFVFKRYYKCSNGETDDENVWVTAANKLDALSKVREEYPYSTDFILLRVE